MMPYKFLLNGKFVTVANLKPQGVSTSSFEPIGNAYVSLFDLSAILFVCACMRAFGMLCSVDGHGY